MGRHEDTLERVGALLAVGDLDAAGRHVEALAAEDPAGYELGYVALAIHKRDAPTAVARARRALEAGAGAAGFQALAMALLLGGDHAAAIDAARRAVALDRGIGPRVALGSILLAAGRAPDAAAVLRQVVAEAPAHHEALLNLATACAHTGELAEAMTWYARAFEAEPARTDALKALLDMFAEAGRWLGALAALEMARARPPSADVVPTLDVARLLVIQQVLARFPPATAGTDAEVAVAAALASAEPRAPRVQLALARTLLDLGRSDEAAAVVARVEAQPLADAERAVVSYLRGVLARDAGDGAAARAHFEAALAADPTRADAAVNLTNLLLEDGSAEALDRVDGVLGAIPPTARTPELLFNEAALLAQRERRLEARALLERVIRLTGATSRLGGAAQRAVRELGG